MSISFLSFAGVGWSRPDIPSRPRQLDRSQDFGFTSDGHGKRLRRLASFAAVQRIPRSWRNYNVSNFDNFVFWVLRWRQKNYHLSSSTGHKKDENRRMSFFLFIESRRKLKHELYGLKSLFNVRSENVQCDAVEIRIRPERRVSWMNFNWLIRRVSWAKGVCLPSSSSSCARWDTTTQPARL